MPEGIPEGFLKTPEEESALYRVFLDRAAADSLPFVSLVWHPWSLDAFDPAMRMLDQTFGAAREIGLEPTTYAAFRQELAGENA